MNPMESMSAEPPSRDSRNGPSWSGDPTKSPRCGAKTRSGALCRAPAMWSRRSGQYSRCRLHGGASTGPRTPEGLARSRGANWQHGRYSEERRQSKREMRAEIRFLNEDLKALIREARPILRARRLIEAGKYADALLILHPYLPKET